MPINPQPAPTDPPLSLADLRILHRWAVKRLRRDSSSGTFGIF
jgi:hypothetical protein